MGCIKIDKKLNKADAVANFFSALINTEINKLPKLSIPAILMAKARPGLNSDVITATVWSRFNEAGLTNGPIGNGYQNVMEDFARIMIEEIVDAIQLDMRVDAAVDSGMIVTSAGANAGGPVASTGSNPLPHTATGVAQ
jgi:hypothetical protein